MSAIAVDWGFTASLDAARPAPVGTQGQVVYCAAYQPCAPISLEMPFGLPSQRFSDPCCKGIDRLMIDLGSLLAPITPFLTLADCLAKLIDIVLTIPDCLGPPPNPFEILGLIDKIFDFIPCVARILGLAPLPINIIAFAKFVRGLMDIVIAILSCIKTLLGVSLSISLDLLSLNLSTDQDLRRMGACLASQSATFGQRIADLLKSLGLLFTLINAFLNVILSAIPPLQVYLRDENLMPLSLNMDLSVPPVSTAPLDAVITVLSAIRAVANVIAGGS